MDDSPNLYRCHHWENTPSLQQYECNTTGATTQFNINAVLHAVLC